MAAPMFPNKSAADAYWAKNPKNPLNPYKKTAGVPDKSMPPGLLGPQVPVYDTSSGQAGGGRANTAAKAAAKSTKKKKTPATGVTTTTTQTPTTPTDVTSTPITGNVEDQVVTNPGYGPVSGGGTNLAGQFNPAQYAKGMAGMQYDPAITQMATRIKGIIQALPGSLDSLHKAFANLDARAAAPPVISPVGAGTAASNAYAAQLANLENTQNASQSQAAASREADWAQRIKLISGANVQDMRGQLTGLTQARGAAEAGYFNQGIKTKSDLVSQAISNINSIRASNDAQAMVSGQLTNLGLKNDALSLANSGAAIANEYAPLGYQQNLTQGNQTIQSNDVAIKAAKNTLSQTLASQPGSVKNLKNAQQGGPQAVAALTSLIIPTTGIVQDPTTGNITIKGDPNVWAKNGVAQIMRTLPQSNRKNVTQFVNQQLQQAIGQAHGASGATWVQNKNGKWVRPK